MTGIAVIGMAARLAGAEGVGAFWCGLRDADEYVRAISDEELLAAGVEQRVLDDESYVRRRGWLDGVDLFDAELFGYTPGEAAVTDPQQRLFLECAWEALEDAGCDPDRFPGLIGVYASSSVNTYRRLLEGQGSLLEKVGPIQADIGSEIDYLATRVSYKLNLRGPSLVVQTACSSALVAVHLACQSLLNEECDMALSGAVAIQIPRTGFHYQQGGIGSPDGRCRPFDAKAQGTVGGDGVGVLVLRRLEEAVAAGDRVYAVIAGSAMNNDGSGKVGFTAPSVEGQAEVIAEALALAGVRASQVGYVEAHGTGTVLGDPIEVRALRRVFESDAAEVGGCGLGSVKSNLGHLDAAAGVAGLVKTVLAVQYGEIPASLHFESPNPACELAESPFYVPRELTPWPSQRHPRRAGVSSFGIGGTNVHIVLEEGPAVTGLADAGPAERRPGCVLVLSGRSAAAVEAGALRLAEHLHEHPVDALGDVAYTLQVGRRQLEWRRAVVCGDREQALAGLRGTDAARVRSGHAARRGREVVFLFPGQGAQYPGMGEDLYRWEPEYRRWVDDCAELLRPHLDLDIRTILHPAARDQAAERLNQIWLAQPAQFTVCYALARMWMSWGVRPVAMIGHSIAEYAAACLAGVFDLEAALRLVARRGELMQSVPGGGMLSVPLPAEDVTRSLPPELSLAATNGPAQCVVSGPSTAITTYQTKLARDGVECRRLKVEHAGHSGMQDGIVGPLAEAAQGVELRPPQLAYVSGVSGDWAGQEVTQAGYWGRQLRQPVQFDTGLQTLLATYPEAILLEVGPGTSLSSLVRHRTEVTPEQAIASMRHPADPRTDHTVLLTALAELWTAGADINWQAFTGPRPHRRIPIPAYPFQRRRHWIPPLRSSGAPEEELEESEASGGPESVYASVVAPQHTQSRLAGAYVAPRDDLERTLAAAWQRRFGIARIGINDNFFELGGHSLLAVELLADLRGRLAAELSLRMLFEHPTIAGLAAEIGAQPEPGEATTPVAAPPTGRRRPEPPLGALPLLTGQHQAWIRYRQRIDGPHNILPAGLRFDGRLDIGALERSLAEVARRHAVLRASIVTVRGEPFQVIGDGAPPEVPLHEFGEPEALADEWLARELRQPLDPEGDRSPWRALLIRLRPDSHLLGLAFHTLLTDGIGRIVILDEILALYQDFAGGRQPSLPAPASYEAAIEAQQRWLDGAEAANHLAYWREKLTGMRPLDLRTDRPRPAEKRFRGVRVPYTLPADIAGRLRAFAAQQGVTLYMVLLAGLWDLLRHRTGRPGVMVTTYIENRRPGDERLVGNLNNPLLLGCELGTDAGTVMLESYTRKQAPIWAQLAELGLSAETPPRPLDEVLFGLHPPANIDITLSGLQVSHIRVDPAKADSDIGFWMIDHGDRIDGVIEYDTDLFDVATVAGFRESLEAVLREGMR